MNSNLEVKVVKDGDGRFIDVYKRQDVIRVHTVPYHRISSEIGNAIRFPEAIGDVHLKQYSTKNKKQG